MKENRILDEQERELIRKAFLFDTEEEYLAFITGYEERKIEPNRSDLVELATYGEQILMLEQEAGKRSDSEALVLIRFMRETGIRLLDAVGLTEAHLNSLEVCMMERKRAPRYYLSYDGSMPVISEKTRGMLSKNEDGNYFHHEPSYYISLLRRVSKATNTSYHDLRRYGVLRQKVMCKSGAKDLLK